MHPATTHEFLDDDGLRGGTELRQDLVIRQDAQLRVMYSFEETLYHIGHSAFVENWDRSGEIRDLVDDELFTLLHDRSGHEAVRQGHHCVDVNS